MGMRKCAFGEYESYTIENINGALLRVSDLGAAILSLNMPDRTGRLTDVVLGYDTPGEYLMHDGYVGAFVGRYANRISGAGFRIGDREYALTANEEKNTLHGGNGLSLRRFSVIESSACSVTFAVSDPDGSDGFPGNVHIEVKYELNDLNELIISYYAVSDADTYLSLTNHSYFNLSGSGDILSHELMINAESYLPVNNELLPEGQPRHVSGTEFDFTHRRTVKNGFYDHCFVISGSPCAELYSPVSGIKMTVRTDMPALQLYAGGAMSMRMGKNGAVYGPNSALCIETQFFPDSPNHPEFPSALLRAGREFRSETTYSFSVE